MLFRNEHGIFHTHKSLQTISVQMLVGKAEIFKHYTSYMFLYHTSQNIISVKGKPISIFTCNTENLIIFVLPTNCITNLMTSYHNMFYPATCQLILPGTQTIWYCKRWKCSGTLIWRIAQAGWYKKVWQIYCVVNNEQSNWQIKVWQISWFANLPNFHLLWRMNYSNITGL